MNRETKRMLQRQGVSPEGGADAGDSRRRQAAAAKKAKVKRDRTSPAQFVREVRGELRRVAWPSRPEVVNYSTVVLVTVILLTLLIVAVDYVSAKSVLFLFET